MNQQLRPSLELGAYVGAWLRGYRMRARLSQADAANAAGVAQSSWSRWERGNTTPDLDTFCALCSLFRLSATAEFASILEAHGKAMIETAGPLFAPVPRVDRLTEARR